MASGTRRRGGVSPQGLNQVEVSEFMKLHKGMEDLDVELVSAGDRTRQNVPDLTQHKGEHVCTST